MERKWQVDPGVRDMIEYFDEPSRRYNWGALKSYEIEAIKNEIRKCRENGYQSFEYAARNYFWIIDKQRNETNFRLWKSQELILDVLYELREKGKPQRIMVLKARQLGVSTLVEALIAWRVIFFRNIEALVVSVDRSHASYLFSIMTHILDRLPWWMKPMVASRRLDTGLWFENPDPDLRHVFPGLNSRVVVQASNQYSGIGQGRRINAAHISEGADWNQEIHREAMEGDLIYALADNPETFAVWESTAKGAGTYTEALWRSQEALGDMALWRTVFLPWWTEPHRVVAPPMGWRPEKPELIIRDQTYDDWVRCDQPDCQVIRPNHPRKGVTLAGSPCPKCGKGTLKNVLLTDEQLCWIWTQRKNKEQLGDPEAMKRLKQELCSTAREAFQIHGYHVFPPECWEWVNETVRAPRWAGFFDQDGHFHAHDNETGHCFQPWCTRDHRYDYDLPMEVWKLPEPGARYVVGVDVAEGLGGNADYSVAFVLKVSDSLEPDEQVAMFRSNTIDTISLAYVVTWIGYWYNTAMLSIEYQGIGSSCADYVRIQLCYPNLYRWVHPDSERIESSKWHWYTNPVSKPKLRNFMRKGLLERSIIIRSEQFYEEMQRFKKDEYDDTKASAEEGWHDDVVMAAMIAYYTAHQTETERLRYGHRTSANPNPQSWKYHCEACGYTWNAESPTDFSSCIHCHSINIKIEKQGVELTPVAAVADPFEGIRSVWEEFELGGGTDDLEFPLYQA